MVTAPGEPDAFSGMDRPEVEYDQMDLALRIPEYGIKGEGRRQLRTLFMWHTDLRNPKLPQETVDWINWTYYGVGGAVPYDKRARALASIAKGHGTIEDTRAALSRTRSAPFMPPVDDHALRQEALREQLARLDEPVRPVEPSGAPQVGEVDTDATLSTSEAGRPRSRPRELRLKPSEGRPSQGYEGRRLRGLRQKVAAGLFGSVEEADKATPRRKAATQ